MIFSLTEKSDSVYKAVSRKTVEKSAKVLAAIPKGNLDYYQ